MNARIVAGSALVVVVAVGVWWVRRGDASPPNGPVGAPSSESDDERSSDRAGVPSGSSMAPAPAAATVDASFDRAARDRMRDSIWKAFGTPAPDTPPPSHAAYVLPEHGQMWTGTEGVEKDGEPGIEPEYIQDSVRSQFFPVANKCYGDALEKTSGLQGQIDLWFVIVGDAKVGGIVESVDVLNKSTLRDPVMIECLRESFLGVTFPPPKGGGIVTVEYPIIFSPDDDDGGKR